MKSRVRWGLLLACLAAPSAVSANPGPTLPEATIAPVADLFPRPALLEPNVAFWTDVFAQYSEYQSVIHSQDEAHKVYAVLDFRDEVVRLGPAAARRG
jgi:hypothetical protein